MKTETGIMLAGAALAGAYLLSRSGTAQTGAPTPQIIALPSSGQQGFSIQDVTALFSAMKTQAVTAPNTIISLGGAAQPVAQIPSIKHITDYALSETYRTTPAFSGSDAAQKIADANQTDPAKALGLLTQWAAGAGATNIQNLTNDALAKIGEVGKNITSGIKMPTGPITPDLSAFTTAYGGFKLPKQQQLRQTDTALADIMPNIFAPAFAGAGAGITAVATKNIPLAVGAAGVGFLGGGVIDSAIENIAQFVSKNSPLKFLWGG